MPEINISDFSNKELINAIAQWVYSLEGNDCDPTDIAMGIEDNYWLDYHCKRLRDEC